MLVGKNATIDGASFQIASPKEINRVSKLIRTQLGLDPITVDNHETRMYKMQKNYNGYNKVDFVLPGNAEYNVPGSGSSSEISDNSSYTQSSSSLLNSKTIANPQY